MFVTIIAVLFAFFMGYMTPVPIDFDPHDLSMIMLVGGSLILLGTILLIAAILIPYGNLEQQLVPNLTDLIKGDRALRLGRCWLFLFALISYICVAFVSRIKNVYYQDWFFLTWLVLFGISLDVLRDSWRRLLNFLNPSYLVTRISQEAITAVKNGEDALLWSSLDNLAEIGVKSVEKSKLALSTQTLKAFPPIIQAFLASSKSISRAYRDAENLLQTKGDEASYTAFYLLQRLEVINDRALKERLESVCRQMIMSLGKIIVSCAHYDLSMVSFPTHFLTKFGLKAQQQRFEEVGVLATSTLLEIARTILTDIDVTYAELQEPFKSIINGLDALAKGTFKIRKDTNIKVLVQPLIDLKGMFQRTKMASHRDTPIIIAEIDKVIEEFTVLEQVIQTMPPIPEAGV